MTAPLYGGREPPLPPSRFALAPDKQGAPDRTVPGPATPLPAAHRGVGLPTASPPTPGWFRAPRAATVPAPAASRQSPSPLSSQKSVGFWSSAAPGGCHWQPLPAPENAASSPAASHCLMSTKYFHVANYLVRLCCCGQRWHRENPPGAAPAPGKRGEPRQGPPQPFQGQASPSSPSAPNTPLVPRAAFISSRLTAFPRPQGDDDAVVVGRRDLPGI